MNENLSTGLNTGESWDNALRTTVAGRTPLQRALDLARDTDDPPRRDEIWVAAGTYVPTDGTDRTVSFIIPLDTELYGGFDGSEDTRTERNELLNVTILSGDIGTANDSTDNSYHIMTIQSES